MFKLFHTPTIQDLILEASADLNIVPQPLECLMFSIYSASVDSMRDSACLATMNEPKALLAARFQLRCRQALTKAQFLGSSDLLILQAYTLLLASIRNVWDASRLWVLVSIAMSGSVRWIGSIGMGHFRAMISSRCLRVSLRRFIDELSGLVVW